MTTQHYHFATATDWEYDWDFIQILEQTAHGNRLSAYIVWPPNLEDTMRNIENGNLSFGFFLDRASDTSAEFLKLQSLMIQKNVPVFDRWQNLKWAADKAIMHSEFKTAGISTPETIVLPSFKSEEQISLSQGWISNLGNPFIAKPANTVGGGSGVIKEMRTLEDIVNARQTYSAEKYLLQQKVIPLEQDNRRFWFRGFYTCGLVQAAWWNDQTHEYDLLTDEEVEKYQLHQLFQVIEQIAEVCKVNFFSTEIAFDCGGRFVAIDYVNEVCDMRLKSRHFDGVPDVIVHKIASRIVEHVKETLFKS